jgi:hypothetical protein
MLNIAITWQRKANHTHSSPRGREHAFRDLILKLEDLFKAAIEPVGPDVATGCCLDQLARNPNTAPGPSYRTFENVADAKFSPDLTPIYGSPFVGEGGVPRDYEESPARGRRSCS